MKIWPGSNLSPTERWAEISQNHRPKYENLDEHNFPVTIPEVWVWFKHLKYMLIDNILKNMLFYVFSLKTSSWALVNQVAWLLG